MMLYAAAPVMTLSRGGCQSPAADSRSDTASTLPNKSTAATTSAPVQSVLAFHSPLYLSGPSSPSSTDSSRCFCVQAGPMETAVIFLALSVAAWLSSSDQVRGGPARPALASTFGLYQMRLARWMFTGTE